MFSSVAAQTGPLWRVGAEQQKITCGMHSAGVSSALLLVLLGLLADGSESFVTSQSTPFITQHHHAFASRQDRQQQHHGQRAERQYNQASASNSSRRRGRAHLSASSNNGRGGGGQGRGGSAEGRFSWDEDVLDRSVKNLLLERAENTVRHYWSETRGDLYAEWLDRFGKKQQEELGDDVLTTLGWGRYLLKMMNSEPVEAVVVRTARKDIKEVVEARRKSSARPVTLSPWRHTVNRLAADWDKEDEEEMKVALDHPPRLEAVKKGVVMQPVDIVKRIMAIREALAKEWLEDLVNVQIENDEIRRLGGEIRRAQVGDDVGRRLTYDHAETFGGNSSPFRAENYEALLTYLTDIGALAVQEKMRVARDGMGWNWMEQFLFWAKANSQSGSMGPEAAGSPPLSPSAAKNSGVGWNERGARGKQVGASFGSAGGAGMHESEEDKKMRGNYMLEAMMMGSPVRMFDTETGEPAEIDPSKICDMVMEARLGVAQRIRAALESVPEDHAQVLRRYLQGRWESSPDLDELENEAE